ncbi:MAG: hypothetical protein SO355_10290 [Candidatus Faecousia sp.]|nr:hypothetical protein [Candidatus Faecousia sp.]
MDVLRELWRGEISPTDRRVRQGSEYQQTAKEVREKMGEFLEMLSPEARERLEAINDLKSDLSVMANEDYFLYGFRLGARMILDIIGDYEGQFCSPEEAG